MIVHKLGTDYLRTLPVFRFSQQRKLLSRFGDVQDTVRVKNRLFIQSV